MNKRVIIDVGLTEERVAVIEGGRLVEIHIEKCFAWNRGSICRYWN